MKKIKVLLGDLRHYTLGVHSNYVPVGIGYIATYLQKVIPSVDFDIKITVNPDEAFDLVDNWKPDVLGLSNYMWNSNLSYRVCEYIKEKNENTLCILGGPEFPTGTGASFLSKIIKDECYDYLKDKDKIDYYCYSDGETSLASVVQEYVNYNFDTLKLRKNNVEIKGTVSLSHDKKKLLVGKPIMRLGLSNKVDGRDCIPSPYLNGLLDNFLDGNFIPSFETARGCPFFCTFCDQGLDMTKIVSFSTKRMTEELDYVCEKVSKLSGTKTIAFHDSNWGMYQKDVALSDHLLKLIDQHDWPSYIKVSTPKNKRQQLLDIDSKLKNRIGMGLAQQSMNQETLKTIKRENLKNDEYIKFVKELVSRGKKVGCELIVPLPNETKQTYFDSTQILLDCGVNIGTYTLMMLQGAELGRAEAINKYKMKSKWRIIPRDFGIYRGKKVFDIERICVATETMPHEDYLACRRFSFLVDFYSYPLFDPIRRLMEGDLKISYFEFVKFIFDKLEENIKNLNPNTFKNYEKIYYEFNLESQAELFESKEHIYNFFSKDENYKKLLKGEFGDNLMRKYAAKALSIRLNDVIDFSIDSLIDLVSEKSLNQIDNKNVINSTRLWLKNLFIFNGIFDWEKEKNNEPIITLDYDIPNWFKNYTESVYKFKKKSIYQMKFNKKNESFINEIKTLYGCDDKVFTIGKTFHELPIALSDFMKSSVKVTSN